jgi:DNA adenine methylase
MKLQTDRALLKYLGAKWSLAPWILSHIGHKTSFVEPFCGGGSVYFSMRPEKGWLNDLSDWGPFVFTEVRDSPIEVYRHLREYSDWMWSDEGESRYYTLRESYRELTGPQRAAAQMTLATCGFNGLTRFSKGGKWNVAYGKRFSPNFPKSHPFIQQFPFEVIQYYSRLLKDTKITSLDFEEVIDSCEADDFIYCDPPYLERNDSTYLAKWTEKEAVRLRDALIRFKSKGGEFAVSEMIAKDGVRHTKVDELWNGFRIEEKPYKYVIGVNKLKTLDLEGLILSF